MKRFLLIRFIAGGLGLGTGLWLGTEIVAAADIAAVRRTPDGGLEAVAPAYSARLNAGGVWTSLRVGDQEFLRTPRSPAAGGPQAIWDTDGERWTVRRGKNRQTYRFEARRIVIEQDGGGPSIELGEHLTALVLSNGTTLAPVAATGDVVKIMAGRQAIRLSEPCHVWHGRVSPSRFARGTPRDAAVSWAIECGVEIRPIEWISLAYFDVERPEKTAPQFAAGTTPEMIVRARNLGPDPVPCRLRIVARFGRRDGQVEFTWQRGLELEGSGQVWESRVAIPAEKPGFYYLRAEVLDGERSEKEEDRVFIHAAEAYRPSLPRPADFDEFWHRQLQALRDRAPVEAIAQSDRDLVTHRYCELRVPLAGDRRVSGGALLPKAVAPWRARLIFHHEGKDPYAALRKSAEAPSQEQVLWLSSPMPNEGKFTGWRSAEENEMMEAYQIAVRLLDWAASLEEVRAIRLIGNSRSGPLALVAAALAPTKVEAVVAHVPTSMGISWETLPYDGWGKPPAGRPEVARYVDPVHFAPMMRVPFIMDGGGDDGLSPCPGMLAFYHYAESAPWKRLSLERGGHGYFTSGNRQRFIRELDAYLRDLHGGSAPAR